MTDIQLGKLQVGWDGEAWRTVGHIEKGGRRGQDSDLKYC